MSYKRHKLTAHDRTEKMNPAFRPNTCRRYIRKRKPRRKRDRIVPSHPFSTAFDVPRTDA